MTTHKRITYVQLNARIAAATDGQVAIRSYDGKDGNLGFVFYDGDRDEKRAMTHFAPVRHTKLSAISVDQWIEEANAYQADVKSRL